MTNFVELAFLSKTVSLFFPEAVKFFYQFEMYFSDVVDVDLLLEFFSWMVIGDMGCWLKLFEEEGI